MKSQVAKNASLRQMMFKIHSKSSQSFNKPSLFLKTSILKADYIFEEPQTPYHLGNQPLKLLLSISIFL